MMKSRLSLRNLARAALSLFVLILFVSGCSSSTEPTYKVDNIAQTLQELCKKEYRIDLKAKLVGRTLWIYLPLENLLAKPDKPEKYFERFEVKDNKVTLKDKIIKAEYLIKNLPEKEKFQETSYDKDAVKKIGDVWVVLRRIMFSLERSNDKEPQFIYLIAADIKNSFEVAGIKLVLEISDLVYYLDLKKLSYGFISLDEYHHRSVQETIVEPMILGDKEGRHLQYKDVTMKDFITAQIQHRIRLKFQKPEVEKYADIDKEIFRIVVYTIKTYGFRDFSEAELYNAAKKNRLILNRAAVFKSPTE